MTAFLDTSVLVRYLVGDVPGLLERARGIVDSDHVFVLTNVVLAETAYVLTSVYKLPRADVVDVLIEMLARKNISTEQDKAVLADALLLCRPSGRVSFADALLWASARSCREGVVFTFDRRFPDSGITLSTGDL